MRVKYETGFVQNPLFFMLFCLCALFLIIIKPVKAEFTHAIAMRGDVKYAKNFSHFDYVNPDAPQAGEVRFGASGSFDSLNPFAITGRVPAALKWTNFIFEPLMVRGYDEPFSLYAHIAEKVELAEDRSFIRFKISPHAHFSDGQPLTVNDVAFSFEKLKKEGRPGHRNHYAKVIKYEIEEDVISFYFPEGENAEAPLLMANLLILPEHIYKDVDLTSPFLDIPIGSGPYTISQMKSGDSITFNRDSNYWANGLNSVKGFYNFTSIHYSYYKDATSIKEAFKVGDIAFRSEDDPEAWQSALDFPAGQAGEVKKSEFNRKLPKPYQAIVFNTRIEPLDNKYIRKALFTLFDAPLINKNIYGNIFERTTTLFDGSPLSPLNIPLSELERTLLNDDLSLLEEEAINGTFDSYVERKRKRQRLREALDLFEQGGYSLEDGVMVSKHNQAPLRLEFLMNSKALEPVILNYKTMLENLGIQLNIRQIDSAQYANRKRDYVYDLILNTWYFSLSPGNEQTLYWTSEMADTPNSRNYMGIKVPQIDHVVDIISTTLDEEELTSATHALGRLFASGYYTIPLFHPPAQWIIHWDYIKMLPEPSWYGSISETWWYEE